MATLGLSKVFILDKYFTELQKFWETEKKLQGECANKHFFFVYFGVDYLVIKYSLYYNNCFSILYRGAQKNNLFVTGCGQEYEND